MKGAVNINTSPPTAEGHKTYRGSQPCFGCDELLNQLCGNSVLHHHVVSSSETEKRCGGQCSPTTVLFESQWTTAFPGRARGDSYSWAFGRSRGPPTSTDPHPRPYPFRAHRRRRVEFIVLPANRSKRLCRRIQFLGIERFSFLPDSQRNGRNLARQCQPSHLGPYPLLLETLNVAAVRLASATGNGRADEQFL